MVAAIASLRSFAAPLADAGERLRTVERLVAAPEGLTSADRAEPPAAVLRAADDIGQKVRANLDRILANAVSDSEAARRAGVRLDLSAQEHQLHEIRTVLRHTISMIVVGPWQGEVARAAERSLLSLTDLDRHFGVVLAAMRAQAELPTAEPGAIDAGLTAYIAALERALPIQPHHPSDMAAFYSPEAGFQAVLSLRLRAPVGGDALVAGLALARERMGREHPAVLRQVTLRIFDPAGHGVPVPNSAHDAALAAFHASLDRFGTTYAALSR